MPATFPSHAGFVLPLKLWRPAWFDGVALVVGSTLPDLLYVGGCCGPPETYGHTWRGTVALIPLGLVLSWLVRWAAPTAAAHLPMAGPLALRDYGGQSREVASGIGCWASWTDDPGTMLVELAAGGECRLLDVATGALSPLPENRSCEFDAFAPGGAFRAHYPVVEDAAGTVMATLPSLPPPAPFAGSPETFGVSADGRYVAMGESNTDPSRRRTAEFLYDTAAGAFVETAALLGTGHSGERVTGIHFVADGSLVVSTHADESQATTWYLLDSVGTVTAARQNAPDSIKNGLFVYLP